MSDSLYAFDLPSRLAGFLSGLPMQRIYTGAYRASLVPDATLFTYHARLPRRTLRNLTVSFAETVPSVLSSVPLSGIENFLILVNPFSGLHAGSGITFPCGL